GRRPVLVDVDRVTMTLDPERIPGGPRAKAILAAPLFGRPCRIEELPDLPVIEDAAGALGARRGGRACGSLGVAACLSFHPRKIVTTGEGGAGTTRGRRVDPGRRGRGPPRRGGGGNAAPRAPLPPPGPPAPRRPRPP